MAVNRDRDRRIRQANERVIEEEIRRYHRTLEDLRELEEAIALPGHPRELDGGIKRTEPSDPTPIRAIRMITSAELLELRRRVDAIGYMLRILKTSPEPGRYEQIKLMYWDKNYTVREICDKLSISERTYYYWRRDALQLVAARLGWKI